MTLKELTAIAPSLHSLGWSQHFLVATGASNVGIGAVLFQGSREDPKYITTASRALSPSERNYSATKKELLGIVFVLAKFRCYLAGTRFHLDTDRAALAHIFTQPKLSPMLERWLHVLLEIDSSVEHLPGVLNVLPNCLSRLYFF